MGFIVSWDADKIIYDLRRCAANASSPYNDGFTAWGCKQDLYRVKFALDQMIKESPEFAGEQEWVEKQMVWKVLNDKV